MNAFCLAFLSFLSASVAVTPDFRAYAGNYRCSANEIIAIAEWELDPSSPHALVFTNLKTGRIGVLTELGGDEFALHEGLLAGVRQKLQTFDESGMGYWRVRATLADGRVFENVYINDLYELGFPDLTPFAAREIIDVEWGGYRGNQASGAPVLVRDLAE